MPGTLFAENMLRDGEQRLLWPAGAPGAEGDEPTDIPAISIHLPEAAMATGTGIVVNPGGGYRILASDHEGLQVARWLNRRGIAAFVLRNRVGPNTLLKYHYWTACAPYVWCAPMPRRLASARTDLACWVSRRAAIW